MRIKVSNKKIVVLLLGAILSTAFFLFQRDTGFLAPKLCSIEEITETLKQKTLDISWTFGPDSYFRFKSGNQEIDFEICLGKLPPEYDNFLSRFQNQFVKNTSGNLVFFYRLKEDGSETLHQPSDFVPTHPDEPSYLLTKRRVFENAHPQQMSQMELIQLIKSKNVLFYTGTGLSLASEVPTRDKLHDLLGLEVGERVLFSLEKALTHPREVASKVLTLHQASLSSPPTPAHIALKELAVFKNVGIITKNLDVLHERSGISPYRIDPHQLRQETGKKTFLPFDYIICVGLSSDDRGFLGWYKEKNPQGKIVALDLKQPPYLGDEDFLMTGDIQEILPAVQQALIPK
jgi:NAD-dependent SIR2 family protein deacetylase